MTVDEREYALQLRHARRLPWHTPPHLDFKLAKQYLVSASCYEHACVIGKNPQRMTECESEVTEIFQKFCSHLYAWCVLPNHYHALVKTYRIAALREEIGTITVALPSTGTVKTTNAAAKSGTTASKNNEVRTAFLGYAQLCTPQSRASRLCKAVAGLAVVQRPTVFGNSRA
jgi:hypothetical protein